MLRVVLADHHRQALRALDVMLQEEPGLEVVGVVVDAEALFALAEETTVDLIMMDMKLPDCHIKDLISNLHALRPRPIVIVMSTNIQDSREVLQAGADAFVSKADQPDWLLKTLRYYTTPTRYPNGSE